MLSAIQPTNPMTLGNYLGAIRRWAVYQRDYDSIFFAVDLHAITVRQDPLVLREHSYRIVATFLAAGLDPKHSLIFVQSHVPEHAELGWVLNCHGYMGELYRMTQFKEKSDKAGSNVPAGLFTYPTLMAADILLYQAHLVPVGADQKQHVELARDLALRMNHAYGSELFTMPAAFIAKSAARIMSLQEPTKKMSKSDSNPKATIFVTDNDREIEKKVKSAVTDSGGEVTYEESKPGIRNLLEIQAALTDREPRDIAHSYAGKQYGALKADTAELVMQALGPIRDGAERLLQDRGELDRLLAEGASRARDRASRTLERVYDALGLVPSSARCK
jgi:tryptophanyl-tRNA synthetase